MGEGKTHASLFFSAGENIPETSPSVQNIEVLRVQTPTETGNPARDFYLDVMEQVGLERIGEMVNKTVESGGVDVFKQTLRQTMVSSDFVNALLGLGVSSFYPNPHPLLSAYFLDKCTTSELRKLSLNRNIEKNARLFSSVSRRFAMLYWVI